MASRRSFQNRERFRRILINLPKKEREHIKAALKVAGAEIVITQKELCPFKSGRLRNSIKATPANEDLPAYATLRSKRPTQDPELAVIISAGNTDVRYAAIVEYGTKSHSLAKGASLKKGRGQRSGSLHPGQPAQPYFGPGFRAHKKDAQLKINKAARAAIKDAIKAAGG